jgi:hypothetical protein
LYISQIINKQGTVIHSCNLSNSRARDRRMELIRPAWPKLAKRCLTINITIKGMGEDFKC